MTSTQVVPLNLSPLTTDETSALADESLADLEAHVLHAIEDFNPDRDRVQALAYVAIYRIHGRRLYGRSFAAYVQDRLGMEVRTGYRWVKMGEAVDQATRAIAKGKLPADFDLPSQRAAGAQPKSVTQKPKRVTLLPNPGATPLPPQPPGDVRQPSTPPEPPAAPPRPEPKKAAPEPAPSPPRHAAQHPIDHLLDDISPVAAARSATYEVGKLRLKRLKSWVQQYEHSLSSAPPGAAPKPAAARPAATRRADCHHPINRRIGTWCAECKQELGR